MSSGVRPPSDDPAPATFHDGLATQVALDVIGDSSTTGGTWTTVASR